MATYDVEIVVHGRVSVTVEADSEDEATDLAWGHPDFPALDKYYGTEVNVEAR